MGLANIDILFNKMFNQFINRCERW